MAAVDLTVIIATYDRAERLRACLEALARQTVPAASFEVVVVVDGSTDGTLEMLAGLSTPYLLRVIPQNNAGQPAALNRGLHEAAAGVCLFLDDDIIADPGLLAAHWRAHRGPRPALAVGQLGLVLPSTADWYARAFAASWQARYQTLNADPAQITWEDCYSGNLSAPRALLLTAGGFATDMPRGFDVDLAYRLQRLGCVLAYLPDARAVQDERKGFAELSRDAELAGFAEGVRLGQAPARLSSALASFRDGRLAKRLLRYVLVGLRVPPRALVFLGHLLPIRAVRRYLHSQAQNLAYWHGVRRAIGQTPLWRALTTGRLGVNDAASPPTRC
jgi:glycosyltransferase involved in cell wall biosynthesis